MKSDFPSLMSIPKDVTNPLVVSRFWCFILIIQSTFRPTRGHNLFRLPLMFRLLFISFMSTMMNLLEIEIQEKRDLTFVLYKRKFKPFKTTMDQNFHLWGVIHRIGIVHMWSLPHRWDDAPLLPLFSRSPSPRTPFFLPTSLPRYTIWMMTPLKFT